MEMEVKTLKREKSHKWQGHFPSIGSFEAPNLFNFLRPMCDQLPRMVDSPDESGLVQALFCVTARRKSISMSMLRIRVQGGSLRLNSIISEMVLGTEPLKVRPSTTENPKSINCVLPLKRSTFGARMSRCTLPISWSS
jgi:hypothetical protein